MYIYSGTQDEGAAFFMVITEARETHIFLVSDYLTSVNIPLTKASHIIKFKVKVWAGIFISWSWEEKVDIFKQ